jgi:hypothetical protein
VEQRPHLHLISDATGETLRAIARAALAQFAPAGMREHSHSMVRSAQQLERAIAAIRAQPGLVFFTLVNPDLRATLLRDCETLGVPCQDVLDGPIAQMRRVLGTSESHRPGGQHAIDEHYLARIDALNFTIQHDDGQGLETLDMAEVVLTGASRTSKTPTCIYLAIRGLRAANVPLVPGVAPPAQLLRAGRPLVVGLWVSPDRLVQVRRSRLAEMGDTPYVDPEHVRAEIADSRKLFEQQDWPSIDVSRRSVEETAAAVLNLLDGRT